MTGLELEVIGKVASPVQRLDGASARVSYSVLLRPFQRDVNKKYLGDEIRLPVSAEAFDQFQIGMDLKVEL